MFLACCSLREYLPESVLVAVALVVADYVVLVFHCPLAPPDVDSRPLPPAVSPVSAPALSSVAPPPT